METKKSRTVAAFLAGLLGMIGAHRFYVGKIGTGIAILLLSISWIGLPIAFVWALIDFIIILSGGFKDKRGNQLTQW